MGGNAQAWKTEVLVVGKTVVVARPDPAVDTEQRLHVAPFSHSCPSSLPSFPVLEPQKHQLSRRPDEKYPSDQPYESAATPQSLVHELRGGLYGLRTDPVWELKPLVIVDVRSYPWSRKTAVSGSVQAIHPKSFGKWHVA